MKRKKIALVVLSLTVTALAIGCSNKESESNKNSSKNDVNVSEYLTEKKTKGEEEKENEENEEYGQVSSIDKPLSINESAITSKTINGSYENVAVTLKNVFRGTEAKEIVNEFNNNHDLSKYPILKRNSIEYVILEYETTIPKDITTPNKGVSSDVNIEITDIDGNKFKNGKFTYVITPKIFDKTTKIKAGDSATTRVIFKLPTTINEFMVKLGDNPNNMAYVIIE